MATMRPVKRRRLNQSVLDIHKADPAVQKDVDTLILDYVIYNALETAFAGEDRSSSTKQPLFDEVQEAMENHLSMVDSFLSIYKSRYPNGEFSPVIRLRIALLRFAVSFTRSRCDTLQGCVDAVDPAANGYVRVEGRLQQGQAHTRPASTLYQLREQNRKRAADWHHQRGRDDESHDARRSSSQLPTNVQLRREGKSEEVTPRDMIRLVDLIPTFVAITAHRAQLPDTSFSSSKLWLEQAANLMVQAAYEQIEEVNCELDEAVWEAFAWGPMLRRSEVDHDAMTIDVNVDDRQLEDPGDQDVFFCNLPPIMSPSQDSSSTTEWDREEAAAIWYGIRSKAIDELRVAVESPATSSTRWEGCQALSSKIHVFMTALASSIPIPILAQLEGARTAREDGRRPVIEVDGQRLHEEDVGRLLQIVELGS